MYNLCILYIVYSLYHSLSLEYVCGTKVHLQNIPTTKTVNFIILRVIPIHINNRV